MHVRDPARTAKLAQTHPVTYMVFDVMRFHDHDVTRLPLSERRKLLDELDLPGVTTPFRGRAVWQVSEQHDDGLALAQATKAADLEGVMSKRRDSVYVQGRSDSWVKVPHRIELVGVIGGWVPETESPGRLGSVWIGHAADEATFDVDPVLYPLARVGSGLGHGARDDLLKVLREIERPSRARSTRSRWVRRCDVRGGSSPSCAYRSATSPGATTAPCGNRC